MLQKIWRGFQADLNPVALYSSVYMAALHLL